MKYLKFRHLWIATILTIIINNLYFEKDIFISIILTGWTLGYIIIILVNAFFNFFDSIFWSDDIDWYIPYFFDKESISYLVIPDEYFHKICCVFNMIIGTIAFCHIFKKICFLIF